MRFKRFFTFLCTIAGVVGESLTPPYFNLADGRHVTATATCGEGVPEPEIYCKLVGANAERNLNVNIIQGQVCDICDPSRPDKRHPPEHAVDGAETWWQSPPLSRSSKLNEVNLTIDFGQAFHVAYVFIRMANSPRPGVWALEKSMDFGKTFTPWQYFADSPSDCEVYFGKNSLQSITRDDSVVCDTQFSQIVPLEGGEILVSLVNNRPSAGDFFNSPLLQEWTKATNVRLRLLRTKTFLGHLMFVARQDPSVTRRYFYSIKDVSIGGRCMCNGHADTCDTTDPNDPKKLVCRCQHNTCDDQCQTCCPGFRQKAWKQSKPNELFICEACNCYGHSDECEYSEEIDLLHKSVDIHGQYNGGGVCKNCRHNTEGINCNKCINGYYRPTGRALNATDVCKACECFSHNLTGNCADGTGQCECRVEYEPPNCDRCSYGHFGYPNCRPCECSTNGTRGNFCEAVGGSCPCKPNFSGKYCNACADKYYDYPNCLPCDCNDLGSLSDVCNEKSGDCTCKSNFGGRSCNRCGHGYFNYPACEYCNCDNRGTTSEVCEKSTGTCICRPGFGGERCDRCLPGFFGYPDCKPCNCSESGSSSTVCDASGKCPCLTNFAGRICDQCSPGYYQYPSCLPCECDHRGAIGVSCDNDGKCKCKPNFDGEKCKKCKEGFYNFPLCEDCNCDPAGVVSGFAGCGSVPAGELCKCKPNVYGRICNTCRPLHWNLQKKNPDGCDVCDCNLAGVVGGIAECHQSTGQCSCKSGVTSQRCDVCKDGFYSLDENDLFGCKDCGCDIGGSVTNVCDKESGNCFCQSRVTGRNCKEPLQAHYFPTLYSQLQYELEDGYTPSRNPARYYFSEDMFPNFSWKGYAVFSPLQSEILHDVFISKPSLYRMILRYVNLGNQTVTGTIKIVPDQIQEVTQTFQVHLKPAPKPTLITVSAGGGIASPLVMNPGQWTVRISIDKIVFLDYFVLLPAAFYEGTILEERIEKPCLGDGSVSLCRHFQYPTLPYDSVFGTGAYLNEDQREPAREFYANPTHLKNLNETEMPLLTADQQVLRFDLPISNPGKHYLIISYASPVEEWQSVNVNVEASTKTYKHKGEARLAPCPYDRPCRQVVIDKLGRLNAFDFDDTSVRLTINTSAEDNSTVAIQSIAAMPIENWSLDYVRPESVCVKKDGICLPTLFPNPPESSKFEFEMIAPHLVVPNPGATFVDDKVKMILLNEQNSFLDTQGSVSSPGQYIFLVQYSQPNHPRFNAEVMIQDGSKYEAKLPILHCPGNTGCRALIINSDGSNKFTLHNNFTLSINNLQKELYLDYFLVIPENQFSPAILEEEFLDQTNVFIEKCGSNNFYIDTNTMGFCRDAVFSLTMDYYDGALKCECSFEGSVSFECEKFGGQCQCKDNIIGRRCDMCKSDHYGFPNCKPCNCGMRGFCDPYTGECICPPHVRGDNCSECEPQTWGYDILYGCIECNCHPHGVENHNMQCDLTYGTCKCKPNVIGRTCDHCSPGHWAFPHCVACLCDLRGTTEDICHQDTSTCQCKQNVYGQACDLCKEGTFHINSNNPKGCTECFCFGKTARCSSSNLYRSQISDLNDWSLAALKVENGEVLVEHLEEKPETILDGGETVLGADLTAGAREDEVVYFSASPAYLNKKLTSYGGNLSYTIFYTSGLFGSAVVGPDIVLFGSESYLLYYSTYQPSAAQPFQLSLEIIDYNFLLPSGFPALRENVMQVLNNLTAIYIRATYWEKSITTRLSRVSLDVAVPEYNPDAEHAWAVEQCVCPPNYQGLSCEECAPGFYRISGPYGGFCIPCKCNGHSQECDPDNGKCFNCEHDTYGDHCEFCNEGYYGNATLGTPFDCSICACPLPYASNNFATTCEVSEDDGELISCSCKEGYYGARCESCAAGYYGNPEIQDDFCRPCNCSGNINPNDPASCESTTGKCLRCLKNTYGEACNICAPWFHGDAITLKDCKSCDCNKCGSISCESYTGQCICHDNVIGETCDRCLPNHYGFNSCKGCQPCSCGIASDGLGCNPDSGQCTCQPGVSGRTCDHCTPGFWNYTEKGCESCGCNTEFSVGASCDPLTGQCSCLPGVKGERCDHCDWRHVFIDDQGCFECDSCTHDLLDTTDTIKSLLGSINDDFSSFAGGYFTIIRLAKINDTAVGLLDKVTELDPSQFDLNYVSSSIEELEASIRATNRDASVITESSEESAKDSERIRVQALELEDLVHTAVNRAGNIVLEVINLGDSLDLSAGLHLDTAVVEAEDILGHLKKKSFQTYRDKAVYELQNATQVRENMTSFSMPIDEQSKQLENLRGFLNNFDSKLEDLKANTGKAHEIANNASLLNYRNKNSKLSGTVYKVGNLTEESSESIKDAKGFLQNATTALDDAYVAAELVKETKLGVNDSATKLNEKISGLNAELDNAREPVRLARLYAEDLANRAKLLNESLAESKLSSGHGIDAARAYVNIADKINEAKNASDAAVSAADKASLNVDGLEERASKSLKDSMDLLSHAANTTNSVLSDLRPQLDRAKKEVQEIFNKTSQAVDLEHNIDKELKKTREPSEIHNAVDSAERANYSAHTTLINIKHILDDVPDKVEQSRKLPKEIGDITSRLSNARNNLDLVNKILPDSGRLLDGLSGTNKNIEKRIHNLDSKINDLKRQIAEARDLANQIRVGVTFQPNTYIRADNPKDLTKQTTSTKISGYFKTESPNGILVYVGNEVGTSLRDKRVITDDFLSLELENGHPVVLADFGSGPHRINSDFNVTLNQWYQFIVERYGKHVKLTIREDLGGGKDVSHVTEEVLPGSTSILNLDPEVSKIYIGGIPGSLDRLQPAIKYSSFLGQMEDVMIGDVPLSMWNFRDANNLNGALPRNRLVNLNPSTGYRFHGSGHVAIKGTSYRMDTRTAVILRFKTRSPDGLLFITGQPDSFLSLELNNGILLYKYNLGSGEALLQSADRLNDDRWHTVEAARQLQNGILRVDDIEVGSTTSPGPSSLLNSGDLLYFGGYQGNHGVPDVTNAGFDGCIDEVLIDGTSVDLSKNVAAFGVSPGCPLKFESLASFVKDHPGYIRWPNATANAVDISVRFKTSEPDGLLLQINARNSKPVFALALQKGDVVLVSNGKTLMTRKSPAYADGEWHVVAVTHNSRGVELTVDDYERIVEPWGPPESFRFANLFVGDVPSAHGSKPIDAPNFIGCISDVTFSDVRINFANITDYGNVAIGKCLEGESGMAEALGSHAKARKYDDDENEIKKDVPSIIPTTARTISSTIKPSLCALPEEPVEDKRANFGSHGYRFGLATGTRIEYQKLPAKFRNQYTFTFDFKTSYENGIILYGFKKGSDRMAVAIQNGKLLYMFNMGSGSQLLMGDKRFDDGKWHSVNITQMENQGWLSVDNELIAEGASPGTLKDLNLNPPIYIGGVPEELIEDVYSQIEVKSGFEGCIHNIKLNDKPFRAPQAVAQGIVPCSDNSEDGVFFSKKGGHVKLADSFRVGTNIEIAMEIKPRSTSGILLAVYGRKDYLLLQMVKGAITLIVDYGKGPIISTYKQNGEGSFCNGEWHKIEAIQSKNYVGLTVNAIGAQPSFGLGGPPVTDTKHPLYLGGVPATYKSKPYVTQEPFIGCIRNVMINRKPMRPILTQASGSVVVSACPTT